MRKGYLTILLLYSVLLSAQSFTKTEIARWEQQAKRVTIIRDNWGIPHIYGKSDADAVFGLMYAQCEDDFKRIEMNFIEKLGRLSEVKGAEKLYDDLLIRLIIDSTDAINDYNKAPFWLKQLLTAQADAYNFFLYKHPTIKPALIKRFKPWFNLLWTDGSIGAINTDDFTPADLKNLYGDVADKTGLLPQQINSPTTEEILTGSNGFAFSPSITEGGKAILYINPHVTFYFRPEVHVVSEAGLNAYGAVTWGQFFVYQGFNEHCGWMHTSGYSDVADTYIETVVEKNKKLFYRYNKVLKPIREKKITIKYLENNKILSKTFNTLYTHHGPIMGKKDGQYLSLKSNNRSMTSLIQCWSRTKAKSFTEFKRTMGLLANTSNNTVYADKEGNIAYWHGNFLPKRNPKIDWSKPVDGSSSATEWKGLHPVEESVHIYNPTNGWIQNCNSTPFTACGLNSPQKEKYPKYMAPDGENFRGVNAVKVLSKSGKYTLDNVIAAGYDRNLAAFEVLIPPLIAAFDKNAAQYAELKEAIETLRTWDFHCGIESIPTTLAIEWGTRLLPKIQTQQNILLDEEADQVTRSTYYVTHATAADLLLPFAETLKDLVQKFGTWRVAWGDLNRFQRISSDIDQVYADDKPSLPVPFASSTWGMLPSYTGRYFKGTKKRYGVNGNSFICAVEFGETIRAKSLLAGGQSGDPNSKHFTDQLEMYTKGQFKEVLFYKPDIVKNAERTYHPGE